MRRKAMAVILAFAAFIGTMSFTVLADSVYTPGTYEASVQGMGGPVTVAMEFSEGEILSVEAQGPQETAGIGDKAVKMLPERILAAQSADVDMVSGATVTSTALLSAAAQCIAEARGEAEEKTVITEETADVIVVGAGAAGLSAAARALEEGASVIVLEANSFLGGAAGTSMGNILDLEQAKFAEADRNDEALEKYAGYSAEDFPEPWRSDFETLQKQIEDYKNNGEEKGSLVTIERVMVDHYLKGHGTDLLGNTVSLDYDLIRSGVENARNNYVWLENYGLTTTPLMEYVSTPAGRGMGLIELLDKAAVGAEIRLSTRATELIEEDGRVTGVIAVDADGNEITYHAEGGVVLATGSFSSNGEMVAKYQGIGTGITENIPSNNPAGNRGDGLVMAEALGAQLRDMSFIQTYLKGYQNLATSGEAGNVFKAAQLVVNADGVRFADESNQNKIVSREGNDQPDGILIAIGDEAMIKTLNEQTEGLVDDLGGRGIAFTGETLEEAALAADLAPEVIAGTVETFNSYVDAGTDPDFGRTAFNGKAEKGPFCIVKLQLACHLTFGGLVIDPEARVLDTEGTPIDGLYAAGDVTSGYEGIVHQTGNCLSIIINTGRTAGRNAARGALVPGLVARGAALYSKGDYEEAYACFEEAAESGSTDAFAWLSKCCFFGRGVEKDTDKALAYFYAAAGEDLEVPADYAAALGKFSTGSAQEDCDPCTWIGRFYYNGLGVEKDYQKALLWFRKAADRQDPASYAWIGKCWYNGTGVEQDYSEAIKWFRLGAENGDVDAYTWIGKSYWHGSGVEQDYEKAMSWYIPAAERGHQYAYTHLGRCYYLGLGVEQDFEEAFKWNMLGAEAGYTYVYWWLGEHYYNGLGVEQNYEEAFNWYMKGAEAGRKENYYYVGKCYCYGTGAPHDLEEAKTWFEKAAEAGDGQAVNMLSHLE